MKKFFLTYWKYGAVPLGAAVGYAYYYFIGCHSGHCAIQSNPYYSTLYGAMLGGIFIFPSKKKKPKSEQNQNQNQNENN
ncbi:MAG: hypothetical protein COT22_09500 [Ignavibacteria bacterium CG08_land_8_20_14_0_20_37_9]|nr:MAG: hypothetical protein COT22_09500 [Ignavibacteria bacterium CG08_land_8_20_14_0_20_37_9]